MKQDAKAGFTRPHLHDAASNVSHAKATHDYGMVLVYLDSDIATNNMPWPYIAETEPLLLSTSEENKVESYSRLKITIYHVYTQPVRQLGIFLYDSEIMRIHYWKS